MRLTHGSTFSGIGAPEVAAAMLGWENVFHCEINPFGRQVLDYYFPNAKSYEDITKTDFSEWRGKIDVLTGGFPCQPFSYAGKRGGAEDDRYLWPYMLRCIEQVRPTWFVGENVSGITTMVLPGTETQMGSHSTLFGEGDTYTRTRQRYVIEEICSNLEAIGYSVQPCLIPACAVGAPHRRDRIFILAHNERAASTNTDRNHDDSRDSREYESKSKRVQERNEIQLVEQPDYVRPTMCSSSPYTSSAGCDRPSDGQRCHHIEGGDVLQERSVRLETRWDGEIGTPSNSTHNGFQHTIHGGAEGEVPGEESLRRQDGETIHSGLVEADVRGRLVADSDDSRLQETRTKLKAAMSAGEDSRFGDGRTPADTERRGSGTLSAQVRSCIADGQSIECDGRKQSATDTKSGRAGMLRNESGAERTRMCDELSGECRWVCGDYLLPEHRWENFPTVSPVLRGDDGLPFSLDNLTIPASKWRTESLKAYGNAWCVQVGYEIFKAIEATYD